MFQSHQQHYNLNGNAHLMTAAPHRGGPRYVANAPYPDGYNVYPYPQGQQRQRGPVYEAPQAPYYPEEQGFYYPEESCAHQQDTTGMEDDAQDAGANGSNVIAERYKTKMCRQFLTKGACSYTEKCMFAHGPDELRTKEMNLRDGLTSEEAIRNFRKMMYLKRKYAHLQKANAAAAAGASVNGWPAGTYPTVMVGNTVLPPPRSPNAPLPAVTAPNTSSSTSSGQVSPVKAAQLNRPAPLQQPPAADVDETCTCTPCRNEVCQKLSKGWYQYNPYAWSPIPKSALGCSHANNTEESGSVRSEGMSPVPTSDDECTCTGIAHENCTCSP